MQPANASGILLDVPDERRSRCPLPLQQPPPAPARGSSASSVRLRRSRAGRSARFHVARPRETNRSDRSGSARLGRPAERGVRAAPSLRARARARLRAAPRRLGRARRTGELRCDVPGRSTHEAETTADLPVVGDWVAVAARQDEGTGTIRAVLPRRTKFSRKTAWQATEEQVLCANVDVVFVVTSLNEDFNLRRIERYLTLAWESGARPVIVLTKADLHPHPERAVAEAESVAFGVPVHTVSVPQGSGLDELRAHLDPGVTAVLLGSSGVGKSTLVNALAGRGAARDAGDPRRRQGRTRRHAARADPPARRWARDRHPRPPRAPALGGGGRARGGVRGHRRARDPVPLLGLRARQRAGCAIRAALDDGRLSQERWESFRKLERELEHLERRLDKRAQSEARRRWRAISLEVRRSGRTRRR